MGQHEDLESVMDAIAGPLTWHHADYATGTIDGRPIGIEKQYVGGSGQVRRLRGVTFLGDLAGRPIGLTIYTSDVSSLGRRRHAITTGDERFDAAMRVDGWPEVSCLAALDAHTRAMLVDTYEGRLPVLHVEHGAICMSRTVFFDNPSRVATPEELAPIARLVLGMADRAVTAFDYTAEEIGRAHGEDAAQSWRTEQSKAQRRHVSGRRGRRVVVFGVFAAIVVGVFVAVANDIGLL